MQCCDDLVAISVVSVAQHCQVSPSNNESRQNIYFVEGGLDTKEEKNDSVLPTVGSLPVSRVDTKTSPLSA